MKFRYLILAGIAVAAISVGHQGTAVADAAHGAGFKFGKPGSASEVIRTIHLDMRNMSYGVKNIDTKEGETIRFVLKNSDDSEHDFTIGPPDVQAAHRKEMMEMMDNDTDMSKHHRDPNAVFVNAGETRELIWTFATADGLEFGCNVPGHYEAGMKGRINVAHGH